jgi:hypothetical protein
MLVQLFAGSGQQTDKMCPIRSSTSYTANKVKELFVDHVYKHHGMPQILGSDSAVVFTSRFWQGVFKSIGTQLAQA